MCVRFPRVERSACIKNKPAPPFSQTTLAKQAFLNRCGSLSRLREERWGQATALCPGHAVPVDVPQRTRLLKAPEDPAEKRQLCNRDGYFYANPSGLRGAPRQSGWRHPACWGSEGTNRRVQEGRSCLFFAGTGTSVSCPWTSALPVLGVNHTLSVPGLQLPGGEMQDFLVSVIVSQLLSRVCAYTYNLYLRLCPPTHLYPAGSVSLDSPD